MKFLKKIADFILWLSKETAKPIPEPIDYIPLPELETIPEPVKPSAREHLYSTALKFLGVDASPKDVAPDEYGCAESVNEVYKAAFGFHIIEPGISTTQLFKGMKGSSRLKMTLDIKPGVIIISPTGYSKIPNTPIGNGHVGICGEKGLILSNNSLNGKFDTHLNIKSWIDRYRNKGGYPIYLFEPI